MISNFYIVNTRKTGRPKGFTLIDVMTGILILFIVVLGSLRYRYVSAANIEKAKEQLTAADLAATFIETWQGAIGSETFDPEVVFTTDLSISSGTGQDQPAGYTLLGKYDVLDDNNTFHLTLSWNDVDASLRELNVLVTWSLSNESNEKTYQLTTYVAR